jgi:hypothetical protein
MNTIKLKIQIAILAMLSLALPLTIPTAHRREQRVIGTVTSVVQNSTTVKTMARTAVTDAAEEDGQ